MVYVCYMYMMPANWLLGKHGVVWLMSGQDLILRLIRIRPISSPETRFQHNDGSKRDHQNDI